MKKWMIKFWYLLPILLVVFILALLILIASVVSWVILLMNKSWWKAIISFVATVIIVSIALFPWLPIAI